VMARPRTCFPGLFGDLTASVPGRKQLPYGTLKAIVPTPVEGCRSVRRRSGPPTSAVP